MVSNLDTRPAEEVCGGRTVTAPVREILTGRDVVLGGTRGIAVTRTLPNRDRRMVGAWCFVDHYGPHRIDGSPGMKVPPHPHTGLQTVSWLIEGEILHRDSLGNTQIIRPGQLNLMTAGRAITHAEETPPDAFADPSVIADSDSDSGSGGTRLHGVQLWVALPSASRQVEPDFAHHADLPVLSGPGFTATVLVGQFADAISPARSFTPLTGVEIAVSGTTAFPLNPQFEYAALPLTGVTIVDSVELSVGPLLYLGAGRSTVDVSGSGSLLLLGGEPFAEEIVMWWNFIGRDHDEIVAMRTAWEAGEFAPVYGFDGVPLPAPALPSTRLLPRGSSFRP